MHRIKCQTREAVVINDQVVNKLNRQFVKLQCEINTPKNHIAECRRMASILLATTLLILGVLVKPTHDRKKKQHIEKLTLITLIYERKCTKHGIL